MLRRLQPHPNFPAASPGRIEAEAERVGTDSLKLTYRMAGGLRHLRLPQGDRLRREHDLWRGTCFEAFLRSREDERYFEINLSPSLGWQVYGFERYRSGRFEPPVPHIRVTTRSTPWTYRLEAELGGLPEGPWSLNLTAVVEQADGALSYWALAHPPGAPDFHHADCFTLDLAAPDRP